MKIENNYSLSFGGNLVNNINIRKLDKIHNKYAASIASFVKINPENYDDFKALEDAIKSWEYDKFGCNVYQIALDMRTKRRCVEGLDIYALTSQTDSFQKLDDKKILGVVQTYLNPDNNMLTIGNLQAKPDFVYKFDNTLKGIGTGILKSLQRLYNKIIVIPAREKSVKKFYERNGFVELAPGSNFWIWHKNINNDMNHMFFSNRKDV